MRSKRKHRLIAIVILLIGTATMVSLVLYSLKQNINLYLTPSQISKASLSRDQMIRVGGLVVKGSVHHEPHSLRVRFILTDYQSKIEVVYDGILPTLFREGQGIIAEGKVNSKNQLEAQEVLAKHDEQYRPPLIKGSSE